MNTVINRIRVERHASWCDNLDHGDDEACNTDDPALVVDVSPRLSIWPCFDPATGRTGIYLDHGDPWPGLSTDAARQLAAALVQVADELDRIHGRPTEEATS